MNVNGRKRLRLIKVIVQPIFVLDDGETLREQTVEPIQVRAEEWEEYPEMLLEQAKDAEVELNEGG